MTLIKGYYGTATISITAESPNTVYSMRIRSSSETRDEDSTAKYTNIEPNEANYIYVFKKPTCMKGFLKNK